MLLSEIADTDLPLEWHKHQQYELAEFQKDDTAYTIQIERKHLGLEFPEFKGKKVVEVSFFQQVDNSEEAFSTKSGKSYTGDVYGIVKNNLKRRYADFDAFYFSAERRHSENDKEFKFKKRLYANFSNFLYKELGGNEAKPYEKESATKVEFIVSKIKLSQETQEKSKFVNTLNEALKSAGMKSFTNF